MRISADAKVLSAVSKPYDFDGKKGVTHKVRLNVEGEIFVAKTDEAGVSKYSALVGRDGEAVLDFTSPAERLTLTLVDFKVA